MTSLLRILISLFYILTFWAIAPQSSNASTTPLVMATDDERMVKWDLSADEVTSLNDSGILEAKGHVYLRRGEEYMKADFVRYYTTTKWVYLRGDVKVRMGKDELQAKEAEFDLRSRVGWLTEGRIFVQGSHAYISGHKISKHFGDIYSFQHAKVTTCDGDSPAWSIAADDAILEIDGYARLNNSSLQIKNTPIAYVPFFLFPTKTARQTGFLIPDFGSSKKKGAYYSQPFFWAIDDYSDLTITEEFMEKRGLMHGLQFRTRPKSDTTAWLGLNYLNDKKNGLNANEGPYQSEELKRTNIDRYWLRGMLDTRLPDPEWRFKADIDYVSDQNFLSDFNRGFSGYRKNQMELYDLFKRDLKEKDQNRESGFLLTREWQRASLALSAKYTQNPQLGHGNTSKASDSTVQRFPQLDAFLYKGRIFQNVPLELEASAQAGYFYRRNGTRGARYTVAPRVTVPITSKYGSIIATGGLTQVYYNTELPSHSHPSLAQSSREDNDSKSLVDYSIAASTDFAKVYTLDTFSLPVAKESVGKHQWTAVKHSIQPRLEYRYRPFEDQKRNPYYDMDDRLVPTNELVYSITNAITRKKETVVLEKDSAGQMQPKVQTSYVDLLRFKVEQAFDHREASRSEQRNVYEKRPFGDVLTDLTFGVSENFSLTTRNDWSPYLSKMTRHQSYATLSAPDIGSFSAGYDLRTKLNEYKRRRTNDLKYVRVSGDINLFSPIYLSADIAHDIKNRANRDYALSITYKHQCFSISGNFIKEPDDQSYSLVFTLTGLGE